MNRAERRRKQRSSEKYDQKQVFTKQEVETMNEKSYELGIEHAKRAMVEEFGIGPKRMEKFMERLRWLQYQDFTLYFQEVNGGDKPTKEDFDKVAEKIGK